MDMAALGQRLTMKRQLQGVSQAEVAKAAQCSRTFYAELERGNIDNTSIEMVERITLALQTTRAYILGDEPDREGRTTRPRSHKSPLRRS